MGSFAFFPLGFILAGPVSGAIGISTTHWISVVYLIVSPLAVLLVPSVRNLRRLDEPQPEPERILANLSGEPAETLHG
jgi:hypothetical protein